MKEVFKLYIHVSNILKYYPHQKNQTKALDNINLSIDRGEFICLLGPSGCGKTTLLNLMAGFERPSQGAIYIDGSPVTGPSPHHVTIFQNYGLLPWRTVQKNIELGLETREINWEQRSALVDEYLDLVGMSQFRRYHPYQLSGGMQQRVAIARALVVDPEILFMDEPFGALDAMTRMKMQEEISGIWEKKRKTIIFVTHDIEESVYLADRIVIMTPHPGRIRSIIKVPLTRKRDRTHPDFLKVRDTVFTEFEMKEKDRVEYYL
ncbi:MAG TPA: ABC transporter ATP-binding protein [Bacillota bacterium]|nr:ABC transporter ATP-binding protein [Bacillota bacterium]